MKNPPCKKTLAFGLLAALALGPNHRGVVESNSLDAAPLPVVFDQDGDGLVDALERMLRTSIERTDTDGDGFDDAEELARRARPNIRRSRPVDDTLSLDLQAYGADGMAHVVCAIYVKGGDLSDISFFAGALIQGELVEFTRGQLQAMSSVEVVRARDPHDVVMLVDIEIEPARVRALGELQIYGIAGRHSTGDKSAAVVDLLCLPDDVIVSRCGLDNTALQATSSGASQVSQGSMHGAGSIYQPLPTNYGGGSDFLPTTWTSEQVCQQNATDVGGSGGVVTREIVEAGCVDEWDAYCSPSCSAAVGTTFQAIDPLALAGG